MKIIIDLVVLFFSFVPVAISYEMLKEIKSTYAKRPLTPGERLRATVLAWLSLTLLGIPVLNFMGIIGGSGGMLGGIAKLSLLISFYQLHVTMPEIVDLAGMKPFIADALMGVDLTRKRTDIFAELEQQELEAIHREQTGKPMPLEPLTRPLKNAYLTPEDALKELEEHRKRDRTVPVEKEELEALRGGGAVDATERFVLNRMRRKSHPWYDRVTMVRVDAGSRQFTVHVTLTSSADALRNTEGLLHGVKEKLFELVRFLWLEPWLKPFGEFIDSVVIIGLTTTADDFGMEKKSPFIQIQIPAGELRKRDGRSYHAPELEPLSNVKILT